MRTDPLSNSERSFILTSIAQNSRLDGRKCTEFRETKIVVGSEYGSCIVMIGNSKVSVQVSCALVEPSSARGNMGTVEVHVDMSPIACPDYEDGRLGFKGVELLRILELIYRDCGVIDLESLCIRAYKQVFQIRIDVHILDADGSLVDCASIASLVALAHFRRPDVTVLPDSIIIHNNEKYLPISLNIYHMPVCVTFGITPDSNTMLTDPTEKEEQCLMGALIVAANKRQEICNLHQSGQFLLTEELIANCVDQAIERATDVTELIHSVITDDNLKRFKREHVSGFDQLISLNALTLSRWEPNELIAPAIQGDLLHISAAMEQVSLSGNQVEIGSLRDQEDTSLMEQIKEVASVADTEAENDLQEVNDLLEGIEEEFCLSD